MARKRTSKKQIIEKSWDIFSDNSFFSISMREIAKHLDIKKSLLYYYFRDKSDLFCKVITNNLKKIFSQFDIIFNADISYSEKIQKLSTLYLKEIRSKSILLSPNDHKMDNSICSVLDNIEQKINYYFEETLRKGIKSGEFRKTDPKNLSMALLGYLEKTEKNHTNNQPNWLEFLYK